MMPEDIIITRADITQAEFSRLVDVTTIGPKGQKSEFQATKAERAALAGRYSVTGINQLVGTYVITPQKKGRFRLRAGFTARLVQPCSISLDPVEETVSGEFEVILQQPGKASQPETGEIDFDFDESDVEIITSNLVDAGELVAQHLSLEINPYPRKADATGEELGQKIIRENEPVPELEKKNPFDVLKTLKHKT